MNVATIGTGFIVDWFLTAVQESANISCVAMFSRKESSAHKLADKYEIDKIYTNLDDMLKDEEMAKILSKRIALDKKAAILVEEANRQGGHDNISLILVEI